MVPPADRLGDRFGHIELLRPMFVVSQAPGDRSARSQNGSKGHACYFGEMPSVGKDWVEKELAGPSIALRLGSSHDTFDFLGGEVAVEHFVLESNLHFRLPMFPPGAGDDGRK